MYPGKKDIHQPGFIQEYHAPEQRFERLANAVNVLIELVKPLETGSVVTEQWIVERNQAIVILQGVLDEAQCDKTREEQ